MAWKCPQCGFEKNEDATLACAGGCGHVKFGQLVLISQETAKQISIGIKTLVGGRLLRSFAGEDAKYASDPQFEVDKDQGMGKWVIRKVATAKNPTFVDGTALPEDAVGLNEGATISLGPEKLKLVVKFQD